MKNGLSFGGKSRLTSGGFLAPGSECENCGEVEEPDRLDVALRTVASRKIACRLRFRPR